MARHRSAITGRYIGAATAARHPRTSIAVSSGSNRSSAASHRSAITGRYVKESTARRHPNTTVTENK